jgi:uncharacterized protein
MRYKLSSYLVFSESALEKSKVLIYSTRTNKLLKISSELGSRLKNSTFGDIPEGIMKYLVDNKVLVESSENELGVVLEENRSYNRILGETLYEVIQPSAWCQLGCHYCGQDHKEKVLGNIEIDKIISRIEGKLISGKCTGLEIGWFGGEPLSGINSMRVINNKLRELTERLNIRYKSKIVTNGVSLRFSVFRELVEEFNCQRFEVTLDGLGDFHDLNRSHKTSKGSFSTIYNNLLTILNSEYFDSQKHSFAIRCNVNKDNSPGIEPLLHKLAEDGIHSKIASIYFMSIYSWAQNDAHSNSFTKEEFAFLRLQWECLKIKLGYSYSFILPRERKYNTCMATDSRSEMYDPYGNIFNCTEVSLTDIYANSQYQIGNINFIDKLDNPTRMFSNWFDLIEKNPHYQCHSCKVFPICGGGCPKSWTEKNAPCPTFRNSIASDIQLKEIMSEAKIEDREKLIDSFKGRLTISDFTYDRNW